MWLLSASLAYAKGSQHGGGEVSELLATLPIPECHAWDAEVKSLYWI
jgi:hypothetical protein